MRLFIVAFAIFFSCFFSSFAESFFDIAKKQNAALLQKTIDMPFNQELATGALDEAKFKYYLEQDRLYLIEYAQVFKDIAQISPNNEAKNFFLKKVKGCIEFEKNMQKMALKTMGIKLDLRITKNKVNSDYLDFFRESVKNGYAVALAAVLPCLTVYDAVGKALQIVARQHGTKDGYKQWIDTYSSPKYEKSIKFAVEMVNNAFAEASEDDKAKMLDAYRRSAEFEYEFWNSAYKLK
jgi:thiaminase